MPCDKWDRTDNDKNIIVFGEAKAKNKEKRIIFNAFTRRCDTSKINFICVDKDFLAQNRKSKIRANLSVL